MANNKAIQLLRGTQNYDPKEEDDILLDGQPFYSKKEKQLYIGDGANQLRNLNGVDIESPIHQARNSDGSEKYDNSVVISTNRSFYWKDGIGDGAFIAGYASDNAAIGNHMGVAKFGLWNKTNKVRSAAIFGESNDLTDAQFSLVAGQKNTLYGAHQSYAFGVGNNIRNSNLGDMYPPSDSDSISNQASCVFVSGHNNTATGYNTTVFGAGNRVYKSQSFVAGDNNIVAPSNNDIKMTTVIGTDNIVAASIGGTVIGSNCDDSKSNVFVIGTGTWSPNIYVTSSPSDLFSTGVLTEKGKVLPQYYAHRLDNNNGQINYYSFMEHPESGSGAGNKKYQLYINGKVSSGALTESQKEEIQSSINRKEFKCNVVNYTVHYDKKAIRWVISSAYLKDPKQYFMVSNEHMLMNKRPYAVKISEKNIVSFQIASQVTKSIYKYNTIDQIELIEDPIQGEEFSILSTDIIDNDDLKDKLDNFNNDGAIAYVNEDKLYIIYEKEEKQNEKGEITHYECIGLKFNIIGVKQKIASYSFLNTGWDNIDLTINHMLIFFPIWSSESNTSAWLSNAPESNNLNASKLSMIGAGGADLRVFSSIGQFSINSSDGIIILNRFVLDPLLDAYGVVEQFNEQLIIDGNKRTYIRTRYNYRKNGLEIDKNDTVTVRDLKIKDYFNSSGCRIFGEDSDGNTTSSIWLSRADSTNERNIYLAPEGQSVIIEKITPTLVLNSRSGNDYNSATTCKISYNYTHDQNNQIIANNNDKNKLTISVADVDSIGGKIDLIASYINTPTIYIKNKNGGDQKCYLEFDGTALKFCF